MVTGKLLSFATSKKEPTKLSTMITSLNVFEKDRTSSVTEALVTHKPQTKMVFLL